MKRTVDLSQNNSLLLDSNIAVFGSHLALPLVPLALKQLRHFCRSPVWYNLFFMFKTDLSATFVLKTPVNCIHQEYSYIRTQCKKGWSQTRDKFRHTWRTVLLTSKISPAYTKSQSALEIFSHTHFLHVTGWQCTCQIMDYVHKHQARTQKNIKGHLPNCIMILSN